MAEDDFISEGKKTETTKATDGREIVTDNDVKISTKIPENPEFSGKGGDLPPLTQEEIDAGIKDYLEERFGSDAPGKESAFPKMEGGISRGVSRDHGFGTPEKEFAAMREPLPEKEQSIREMIGEAVKGIADTVSGFIDNVKEAIGGLTDDAKEAVAGTGVDAGVMQKYGAGQGLSLDAARPEIPQAQQHDFNDIVSDLKNMLSGNEVSNAQETGIDAKVAAHAPAQPAQEEGIGR